MPNPMSAQVRRALEDEAMETTWQRAAKIVDAPLVHEAVQALVDDHTEDNAIAVVAAVLNSLPQTPRPVFKQEFNEDGLHRLVYGSECTGWAAYRSFTFLRGMVGVTHYYTGNGERILSAEEFCKLAGVGKE